MDDVLCGLEGEVTTDRPWRRLVRPRGAVDGADDRDRVRAVEGESHQRGRDDELDQPLEERLRAVNVVVAFGEVAIHLDELQPDELEASLLISGQDPSDELALDAVGLHEDEGPFGTWHVYLGCGRVDEAGIVSDRWLRARSVVGAPRVALALSRFVARLGRVRRRLRLAFVGGLALRRRVRVDG